MATVALIVPFQLARCLAIDRMVALALFAGNSFPAGACLGPSIAVAHAIVPVRLRATASAVIMLAINLIGLGLGPLAVGMPSDRWAAHGANGRRHALVAIVLAGVAAFALFARARMHGRRV